jgi:hypothetical protein
MRLSFCCAQTRSCCAAVPCGDRAEYSKGLVADVRAALEAVGAAEARHAQAIVDDYANNTF